MWIDPGAMDKRHSAGAGRNDDGADQHQRIGCSINPYALSTARKHVNNIIGKLGVNNRTQAVSRRRDLGLP